LFASFVIKLSLF